MRIKKLLLLACFIILYSCVTENIETVDETINNVSAKTSTNNEILLLWNNGMSKRSWLFLNQENRKVYKDASNFWDAPLINNPVHTLAYQSEYIFKDGNSGEEFSVPGMHSPSVKWVTMGYKYEDWKKYPGYDMWIFDHDTSSQTDPIEFRFMNHARSLNDSTSSQNSARRLREVGFVFDNWPYYFGGGFHSFRSNYSINQFADITLTFDAKMEGYNKPYISNDTDPITYTLGGYVTADFRFVLYDNINHEEIKGFLVGILFSNPQKLDYNSNSQDNIIYETNSPKFHSILLDGEKLGINVIDQDSDINTNVGNSEEIQYKNQFKKVTINYKSLIENLFQQDIDLINLNNNSALSFDNTIITGLDIYSASRGCDISFSIKNIELKGIQ